MPRPRITLDPQGLYARLGIPPISTQETIVLAYRRKARMLHPDVPRTGDAEAFMALKAAYDVLNNPMTRAAYDRSGREDPGVEPGEIDPTPFPEMVTPVTRHPRPRDLPVAIWAGMAAILLLGVIEVGLHLPSTKSTAPAEPIPATAPNVPALPAARAESDQAPYGAAPVRLAGTPTFYVTPGASPAMLWRMNAAGDRLVPWGQLPPFSAVQGLRLLRASGMEEVKVTDNTNGFIDSARLTPGDAMTASVAWCTFHAGTNPMNGEVLSHGTQDGALPGDGQTPVGAKRDAALAIANHGAQPMVVKVRSPSGGVLASVFVTQGGESVVDGLPAGPAIVDFATGEVWSRPCHGFIAGMRAQRLPGFLSIGPRTNLSFPLDRIVTPLPLTDLAFEQE